MVGRGAVDRGRGRLTLQQGAGVLGLGGAHRSSSWMQLGCQFGQCGDVGRGGAAAATYNLHA